MFLNNPDVAVINPEPILICGVPQWPNLPQTRHSFFSLETTVRYLERQEPSFKDIRLDSLYYF